MASSNMTQHVSQKSRGSEDEDRISNLPESIIGHILSCLPIKDAVATSVLSKRWVNLWTYITTVCIDDWAFPYHNPKKGINNFENFVSSVLLGLNNSTIQNFSLNVARKLDPSLVNAWISAILKRRVTNFTISSPKNVTIISSYYLFSCNSLVQLILNISCSVRVLASVHLPNLQNLELYGVKFLGESSGISKDMILSFPVLKKFKVKMLWLNVQSVTLLVPLLEVVNIYCESLEYDNCTIKICASCVREFSYDGYLSQYYILSDPSFAPNASAYITIHNCHSIPITENELGLRASMLIRQLDQVKYLKLDDIRVFGIAKEAFVDLPTLEMVHHLKLGYVIADMLLALLLKTPTLITLDIMVSIESNNEELLDYFSIVPDCFSTLKVVKFGNFGGYHNQLGLAKYIMENATNLERLSFSPNMYLCGFKKKKKTKEKLLSVMEGFNLNIIDFSEF